MSVPRQRWRNAARRRRIVVLLVVALAILAGVWALTLVLRSRGLGDAADFAQLLSLPLALLPLLAQFGTWWRQSATDTVVTPEVIAKAKEQLALLVAEQWRAESQIRVLDDPDPIPVQWQLTDRPDLMDSSANRTVGVLTVASSADIATLVAEFRSLRRPRLVILGEAGAGKTTLAVQILLELLRIRPAGSPDPVPVLMSFAGWGRAPRAGLDGWLAEQITHAYPEIAAAGFGAPVVRALVRHRHVLPVLDGLDEIAEDAREKAIEALNRSLDGDSRVIMTSRTDEFGAALAAAGEKVRSAVVLEPEPLTPPAAADYLERCLTDPGDPQWTVLLRKLREAPPAGRGSLALAKVASTPLGLWLIRIAYIATGKSPSELLDRRRFGRPGRLRAHLFDQLIRAGIETRPPSDNPSDMFRPRHEYEPAQVERWLRFLAANMDRWQSRDFDWAEDAAALAPPAPRIQRFAVRIGRRVVALRRWASRLITRDRRLIVVPIALALVTLASPILGTWAVMSIVSDAVAPGPALQVLIKVVGTVVALGLFGGLCLAALQLFLPTVDADDLDRIDWAAEFTSDWYELREWLVQVAAAVTLGLSYGIPAGAISGLTAGIVGGAAAGGVTGPVVGGLVTVLVVWQWATADRAADAYDMPWLWRGWGVWPGVRDALIVGLPLGVGLALYTDALDSGSSSGMFAWFAVLWTAAAWVVLIGVLGVLVPAALAVSRVLSGLAGRTLPRGDPAEDAVLPWRHDRIAHGLRLLRLTAAVCLIAAGAAYAWSAVAGTGQWSAFHRGGLSALITEHLSGVDVVWNGRLSYVVAVLVALLAAGALRRWIGRGWLRWPVAAGLAAAVPLLWSRSVQQDVLRLRLTSRPEGTHVRLGADLSGRAPGLDESHWRPSLRVEPSALGTAGEWRQALLLAGILIAVAVAFSVVRAVRPAEVRVWWSTGVATVGHVARGYLPRSLPVFLDDAHRLGLMRAVGNVYQFRHAELQDHLVRPPKVTPAPPP
jgi:hypothetical protein